VEIRELRAFVVIAEEGGLSAAARKVHVSQSALSQTVQSLERQLGVRLLERTHVGSRTTEAGAVLLREARGLVEHHDQVLAAMATATGGPSGRTAGLIRIGVPLELPADLLPRVLAHLADAFPDTRVEVVHSSSSSQIAAVRSGDLDVGLVRDRPTDPRLDAVLAVKESMGVILAAGRAEEIAEPPGVHLQRLAGLHWMAFARSDAPAWHDQVTATLRAHGIAVDDQPRDDRPVTAEVKLAGIGTGKAFGLASPGWARPLPEALVWYPLVDDPIVRRTWAIWPADARQRDVAALIDALDNAQR
jgi:DNA-binding transcriptional LysR family regulator